MRSSFKCKYSKNYLLRSLLSSLFIIFANMKTSITLLGTGNALATRCHDTCFALGNDKLLVDAGGWKR